MPAAGVKAYQAAHKQQSPKHWSHICFCDFALKSTLFLTIGAQIMTQDGPEMSPLSASAVLQRAEHCTLPVLSLRCADFRLVEDLHGTESGLARAPKVHFVPR